MAHSVSFVNSTSRQCCEVWPSQLPSFNIIKDTGPPSKACLYGHINCKLAQA